MKAEAALASGNAPIAATFMEAGMNKSITKVQAFGSLDPSIVSTMQPDAVTVAAFVAERIADFNAASTTPNLDGNGYPIDKTKMDILGEQYFVTIYGGAADAINFIRRTGHPQTLTRSLEPASGMGTFPRTILYPNSEIVANPNVTQRTDLNTLVFWDSGVTNPAN
jgi:hypothetical protein